MSLCNLLLTKMMMVTVTSTRTTTSTTATNTPTITAVNVDESQEPVQTAQHKSILNIVYDNTPDLEASNKLN